MVIIMVVVIVIVVAITKAIAIAIATLAINIVQRSLRLLCVSAQHDRMQREVVREGNWAR